MDWVILGWIILGRVVFGQVTLARVGLDRTRHQYVAGEINRQKVTRVPVRQAQGYERTKT